MSRARTTASTAKADKAPTEAVHHQSDAIARLFEFADDLLATIAREGVFATLNPAWERALGWSREELLGTAAIDLLHPLDVERARTLSAETEIRNFEARYRCKDGTYRWLQWNARLVEETWYAVARDVTGHQLLLERASRDSLTGLANRSTAIDRLDVAIHRLERSPGIVGVLFVDLDHFKVINDARGHEVGDRFLRAAAARLLDTVRSADGVARFGGDEFVIVVEDASGIAHVIEIARRVVAALARPIRLDGSELHLGASVGVAVTASPGATPDALIRQADIAMYQAKARGGGRYVLWGEAQPRRSQRE